MRAQKGLSDPIAIRVPIDVLASIQQIAELTERSRSWVIVRALKTYLASEGADLLAAANGRREIAEGRSYDGDNVVAEFEETQTKDAAA